MEDDTQTLNLSGESVIPERTTHLHASFVQRSGPVGDPGASFQRGSHEGVMLPALELPEGAEIRVAVVQAHLEEQGDNNEPSSLLVNVAMHPPAPRASQSVSAFTVSLLSREDYWYGYGQREKILVGVLLLAVGKELYRK